MTGGINPERIQADLAALAERTEPDRPWTRRAFTATHLDGRAWLRQAMTSAGLTPSIDAGGNLIGRREGRVAGLGTLALGSHSDTVPDGGRFDGIAGIAAALEVARALDARGIVLDHGLEVIDCLAEEVTCFGLSCIGSRAAAGLLPEEWLQRRAEPGTLAEAIRAAGGAPERLAEARRSDLRAFLELHIEQGPVLEAEGIRLGLVTAIAGITRIELRVEGRADHAGTTPMAARADALVAAADLVLRVRALAEARAAGPGHFAATVGEFSIRPNAANVVPASARLLVDARAEHRSAMTGFLDQLAAECAELARRHRLEVAAPRLVSDNPPTPADPELLDTLEAAAERAGASHRRMASGAGHDMAWFARVAPAAMLFVPCRGGRSHSPDEWAEAGDLALGAEVLLETILRRDRRRSGA